LKETNETKKAKLNENPVSKNEVVCMPIMYTEKKVVPDILSKRRKSIIAKMNLADSKKPKNKEVAPKKPLVYGPRINIPCCVGSKNPCNRRKLVEKWQKNPETDLTVRIITV